MVNQSTSKSFFSAAKNTVSVKLAEQTQIDLIEEYLTCLESRH